MRILLITILASVSAPAAPASAQQGVAPVDRADSVVAIREPSWSALRIGKWTLAAASGGAAIYGFIHNQRADDRFEELEAVCLAEPERCENTLPDGSYVDEALEAEYQEIRGMDQRARRALIAGQIGIAASVVLFILDLRDASPENIPFEPRRLDVSPARDGGLAVRLRVRM